MINVKRRRQVAGGYMGKILFVNLSTEEIKEEVPDEQLYHDFIGGYGVGGKILYSRQKAGADPLGADNILGFVTGLLTGTPAITGARYTVVAKSPLTGGISLLATGLSRTEQNTEAHCMNCGSAWVF